MTFWEAVAKICAVLGVAWGTFMVLGAVFGGTDLVAHGELPLAAGAFASGIVTGVFGGAYLISRRSRPTREKCEALRAALKDIDEITRSGYESGAWAKVRIVISKVFKKLEES
jgi:hypothetical protein